jgi:endonuclease/exonuclease/phosphatase family metal-dependent hydrolase
MQSTIGANQEVLAALRQGRMLSNHERQSLQATWVAAGDRIEDGSQVWQAESELGESGLVDVLKEMGHSLLASEYDAGPGEIEETEELGERDPTKTQDRLRVGCGQLDRTNWYRDWWRAVEAACNWERRRVDGNVITWNIGGEDVLFLLPHIQKTLAKGAAVVMLQELRFHRKKRGRVKAALEALDSNYAVHLARGKLKSKEHDIGAGKLKDRDWAVVTFLHREAFNSGKTVEREWAQGMQQQGAERQFRGRVLWLDAVTASGKAVWIANVHMPTARALDGRQRVFTALQARIAEKKGQMGMLGGDLNAAGHGGVRRNYAAGSAHININADGQLWDFLQMTGGELHSANTATRVGLLSRDVSEAQLDHLVTWNIADERVRGSA